MSRPSLTVWSSNYNHARYLPEALDSIFGQSFQPIEFLMLDDASTDESVQVLEDYARRFPVMKVLRNERNLGPAECARRMMKAARGDFMVGIAADDKVLPGLFERSIDLLVRYPAAAFCSALSRQMDAEGRDLGMFPSPVVSREPCYIGPVRARELLLEVDGWFNGNTVIWRRDALADADDLLQELGAFWDGLYCRVAALRRGCCFLPEPRGVWRRMPGGWSARTSNNPEASLEIMRRTARLMKGVYRDVFPEGYPELWQREWVFDLVGRMRGRPAEERRRVLQVLPAPTAVDRLYRAGLALGSGFDRVATKAYLFSRLRPASRRAAVSYRFRKLTGGRAPALT